jgi:purine-cytosine permease-like protein
MPRQKWRGISIFGMTNPFEPPRKEAFDDAELALAIESAGDALAAMEILEKQANLRAADAQAYVAWVREMEASGSTEAKSALNAARRAQAGLPTISEETAAEVKDENSWQQLVPDWKERQEAQLKANQDAIEEAKLQAAARLDAERETAIATAVAEAEAEAQRVRDEAIEKIRQEAAEKLEVELETARQSELERIEAERTYREEAERVAREEAERVAEVERLEREEAERVAREEAERVAEVERLEREEAERVAREEAERVAQDERLEREEAERVAREAVSAVEPEPVSAAGFATGSFDIIESAEQKADEDQDSFDYLLANGELPFAKEPKSKKSDKPLSTISRRSKAISQLFIWGGLTVGVAPLGLAAFLSGLQNPGDAILAVAIGLLFSSAIISVAAIAGKRSGLSTLILARAAFGVHGNLVSAIPLVIIKLVFGAVVLYLATGAFDGVFAGVPVFTEAVSNSVPGFTWQVAALVALLVVGGVLAFFGGKVLYWAQLSVGAIGAIAVIAFIAATAGQLNFSVVTFTPNADFFELMMISSLVGVFFGAFWITAVAEFTRKIPMRESGAKVSTFVALATGVLPLLISSYGLVAIRSISSVEKISAANSPIELLSKVLPAWSANILLYSAVATLIIWIASWMYATSVSFAAVGAKLRPWISQPAILIATILIAMFATPFVNLFFVGVVVLAWAGIFVGDVAIRRIAYHEVSLSRDYGFYKSWNWVNIAGFVIAVAIGLGLVGNVEGPWSWLGYISDSYLTLGVFIAPLVAFLFPILFGRKRIALQEQEVLKIEARRHDLADVDAE